MPRCDFCGKNVSLPFHCQYCGKQFCDEHRLPPNHACAGLAQWKKTPAPGVGIRYGAGGASAYGGGYAAAPGRKKPSRVQFWKHPYFKAAVVIIILLLIVILFVLLGGCLQPGENNVTITATQTAVPLPTLTAPTGTPDFAATPPNATPATSPSPTHTPAPPHSPQPTVPEEAAAIPTATPPFPMVTGNPASDPYPVSTPALADRIHQLINGQRASNDLAPLSADPALEALALNHSTDMAENNYFSHTDLSGEDPTARGNASGYTCIKDYGSYYTFGIAENIFQNNLYTSVTYRGGVYSYAWSTPEEIAQSTVTGWMNSEGHRKNILTPTYDREGIGVAIASDDQVYITEDFC